MYNTLGYLCQVNGSSLHPYKNDLIHCVCYCIRTLAKQLIELFSYLLLLLRPMIRPDGQNPIIKN